MMLLLLHPLSFKARLGLCLKGLKVFFWHTKVRLKKKKKKYLFDRKIKSVFNGLKSQKIAKIYFWQKLKNEDFTQKLFLT